MKSFGKLIILAMTLPFAFLLTGCPATGVYRTAHTLKKGESDVGITFSGFKIKRVNGEKTDDITIPNFIPEFNYHIGLGNRMEVGGRVALGSLLFELDFKYKFFESYDQRTHMAIAPAVGYRTAVFVEGTNVTLPVILTYDITKNFSFTVFGYSSYLNLKDPDNDPDSTSSTFVANMVTAGGGVGFKYTGETFYFMPSIDVSRSVMDFSNNDSDNFSFTSMIFNISVGWIGGKEMHKLNAMDRKLDRIENKLDQNNSPAAPQPVY